MLLHAPIYIAGKMICVPDAVNGHGMTGYIMYSKDMTGHLYVTKYSMDGHGIFIYMITNALHAAQWKAIHGQNGCGLQINK